MTKKYFILFLSIIFIVNISFTNSRVAFTRPGGMMRTPGLQLTPLTPSMFTLGLSTEMLGVSSGKLAQNPSICINKSFGTWHIAGTGTKLIDPETMELGLHIQKEILKYGDVIITAGAHDFLYKRDGKNQLKTDEISFFSVFSSKREFGNYFLLMNLGFGTGHIEFDYHKYIANSYSASENTGVGVFASSLLKIPYLKKNGGTDLIIEFDNGLKIHLGAKVPITKQYGITFGITNFQSLSDFKFSNDYSLSQDLKVTSPAISFGLNVNVPSIYKNKDDYNIENPLDVFNQNIPDSLIESIEKNYQNILDNVRDSLKLLTFELENLSENNLLLKQKVAVFTDSTRKFHLKQQINKSNTNLIMRHLSRSLNYFHSYQYREALNEIDKAIDLDQNVALAYARRGSIYYHMGDIQRATLNWNVALRLDPEFEEIHDILNATKNDKLKTVKLRK